MRILFLCLGNICRSPLAEGILEAKLKERNIEASVDSAGFESYHINESPDKRAVKIAKKYGLKIADKKCRLFNTDDFDNFDKIYVMESSNYREASYFARTDKDMEKVSYLLNVLDRTHEAVPDPYYGGEKGFEHVFELLDAACEAIVQRIENNEPL